MQAIKDKITDMKELHKAKAEAREVEKAERQDAKNRLAVVHQVAKARKAEAAMDYHVQKARKRQRKYGKMFPQAAQSCPLRRNSMIASLTARTLHQHHRLKTFTAVAPP
ncbi:hypothetical protein SASPL_157541 [Salvia splendens]|uniref:Uncharacterized protein n=1 Tax=Salvia splendens TaxID=180675 RepID=A0A8X8YU13_SALSN|nr:hypothetical protein SASPL_157541 [Salvia splendens]